MELFLPLPFLFVLRRFLHIACSLWLVLLLVFGAAPKEFIHGFANHTDTIHHHDGHGSTVESIHHHCSFLGFHLMAFEEPYSIPFLETVVFSRPFSFFQTQEERAGQQIIALREGRGPPRV